MLQEREAGQISFQASLHGVKAHIMLWNAFGDRSVAACLNTIFSGLSVFHWRSSE
jgi:hypothetical protein